MRNPNTLNELFGCHSALGRNYPKPVPERRLEPNRSRVAVDYHLAWFNVRRHPRFQIISPIAKAVPRLPPGPVRTTYVPAGRPRKSFVGLRGICRNEASWILEPSATGLCEPDLHVFAKLFEDRLERGLEAQALSGREIGGDDDVLNFFVGHLVDVDLTRQPAS